VFVANFFDLPWEHDMILTNKDRSGVIITPSSLIRRLKFEFLEYEVAFVRDALPTMWNLRDESKFNRTPMLVPV